MKKVIHELDSDDLIKLATDSDEEVVMENLSEASKFIYEKGIKNGTKRVTAQLVYYTYEQWRGWNKKKQPKHLFFRDFAKYFSSDRDANGTYYLLDPKPFDLSEETFWQMKADIRRERAKKKKIPQE